MCSSDLTLAVPQADLEDLNRRLDQTRWPDPETVDDWTQGAPLAKVKALVDHWRHRYDWRRCEAMLNDWGQYKTAIDGLDIHFLHVRSTQVNSDQTGWHDLSQRRSCSGSPVAALGYPTLVTESLHQFTPCEGDSGHVPADFGCLSENPNPGRDGTTTWNASCTRPP